MYKEKNTTTHLFEISGTSTSKMCGGYTHTPPHISDRFPPNPLPRDGSDGFHAARGELLMRAYSQLTQNVASRSQGVHGAGARSYRPEQANRLLLVLRNECMGPAHRMTVEALATRVGMNGRAVRDAISDLEKAGQVLTDFADGYYVCATAEQAERATRRLESQIRRMQERVEARRRMAAQLVLLQRRLL